LAAPSRGLGRKTSSPDTRYQRVQANRGSSEIEPADRRCSAGSLFLTTTRKRNIVAQAQSLVTRMRILQGIIMPDGHSVEFGRSTFYSKGKSVCADNVLQPREKRVATSVIEP
jgi:hypothetical protein